MMTAIVWADVAMAVTQAAHFSLLDIVVPLQEPFSTFPEQPFRDRVKLLERGRLKSKQMLAFRAEWDQPGAGVGAKDANGLADCIDRRVRCGF